MADKQLASSEALSLILNIIGKSMGQHKGLAVIEGFESATGVTGSTDVSGITTNTDHRGPGIASIEFDKSGITEAFAYVDKTLDSIDIEQICVGSELIWFIQLSDLTNIANVRIYLGTNASHCAYWQTADTSLSVGWNKLTYNIDEPTALVGNGINYADIDFIRIYVGFDAVGNTLSNIRADSVVVMPKYV